MVEIIFQFLLKKDKSEKIINLNFKKTIILKQAEIFTIKCFVEKLDLTKKLFYAVQFIKRKITFHNVFLFILKGDNHFQATAKIQLADQNSSININNYLLK